MEGLTKISVLIADSQRLFAEALGDALSLRPDLDVIAERPTSGPETVEAVLSLKPDVTLIDYWMASMEGAAVTARIVARLPEAKVILLSWFHGTREVKHALTAGAVGFLPKSVQVEDVAEAIRWAHAGQAPVYPEELEKLVRNISVRDEQATEAWRRLAKLTPREVQILELLAYGQPIAQVARKLEITPATLRTHIHKILDKTGTGSQIEALSLARRYGLIHG